MKPIGKQQTAPHEPAKKLYTPPELQIYGNLQEITQTIGSAGMTDNTNPNHTAVKTH